MATTAASTIRRIPPPRIYASINRRRSTTETKQTLVYDNDHDHEKCLIEENELRELNRRQLIRIDLLEQDYRQLDDDLIQIQIERDLLLKQKRTLEEELERLLHHASANIDLHVHTQRLESECRDLRCQLTQRNKEKIELNDIIADFEIQLKQARERQEEWRDSCTELEVLLENEKENRLCLEVQLQNSNLRQKENENQICRLQKDFEEVLSTKQEIVKSNYILVQNAEALREELRIVRTHAAEVRIICPSISTSFDNLDESLPCLIYDTQDEDTPDCENINNRSENCPSSLFSEINSLEAMSNEIITKCLNSTTNDIELDLLLAKTTTLSSSLSLLNELINEVKVLRKYFFEQQNDNNQYGQEQERLTNMKISLKRVVENVQCFDMRFRKMQLLLIASREQQQCRQAELDDFFRLVDKGLITNLEESSENPSKNQRHLVSILEIYQNELDRLRQVIRTNDDTIRSCERQLIEQQSVASRWRMTNTFLEKNQRKLLDKIKELNSERRQLIESSTHKRTRRRAIPVVQLDQQQQTELPNLFSLPSESTAHQRLTRSRSLLHFKSIDNGRKSRNDSGVVLNDEILSIHPLSTIHHRRRIKSITTNNFVMHTSSHVCFQKTNNNIHSSQKQIIHRSCRCHWFFLLFVFILLGLFSLMKFFPSFS
ncbi:hypothetical protein I4U23_008825 [Adineta vaga]|nr:hypothetical protein I4U23_008825 [Adineta vaga]